MAHEDQHPIARPVALPDTPPLITGVGALRDASLRDVTSADLEEVIRIAQESSFGQALAAAGSLVSGYSREDYERLLHEATTFACVALGDRVLGFVIVLERTKLPLSDGSQVAPLPCDAPSVIIKQISVDPRYQRARVGTVLYREVARRHSGDALGATVVHESRNKASIDFHIRMGFTHIADVPTDQGGRSGFWMRPADADIRPEVLAAQYEQAVQLYKHEDALTWTKMNALIYVSGAIAAAIGFSTGIQSESLTADNTFRGVVAAVAALATWGLIIPVYVGTKYIEARKTAVVNLESKLAQFGGQMVVRQPGSTLLTQSPGWLAMRFMPAILAAGWTTFALVLLL